ncbi:Copia protein [Symbiodinium microadriaticum]|uniref:Copia protein n=1 Tax=Symbiodinium microadriaticum TaxID=2951 RepID=A0A1Q9EB96_SYMMI|nr:Copia protein [Symbiodinium microadriaticum]
MNDGPSVPTMSSTAQQWLGTPNNSQDAIHLIAGGVAQLQAAMLKQMSTDKTGERTPETVKPGTTVLPTLPPVRSESSSVDLLDWMELIEAPMCDLSDGSATWWKQVRSKAASAYDKWVVSGPIERLSITPEGTNDLEEGRWSRVNSRAASMVLTALDESIRSELVSRRMTGSVTAIVFRLLTLYQPGGEEEKYRTLQQLQSPPKETDPAKAVESLRAWNRWLRRCQELNIQAPGPSLQVRALNSVVKGVLEKNSEACFRTNLVRNTSSTSTPAVAASKTVRIDDNPEVEHLPARGSGAASSEALDLKEVLADVGKVLKAMSTTTLKKFTVDEAAAEAQQRGLMATEEEIPHKVTKSAVMEQGENEEGTGLLDSGASHSLRPAKWSEYQKGQPVKVTLAGEDVKLLMQNDYGTILVQEEQSAIQPIVPLGAVIQELGYTLNWSPKALKLTHPSKKSIKVKIRNHCPEVAACDALGLIRDLECAQVNALNERVASLKARLEVIKKEEKRDWLELLREFSTTGTKTLLLKAILTSPITRDLPAEVQTKLVQDFDLDGGESYLKALPLSRRKRKALAASRSWVVHLFSGVDNYKNDPFEAIPTAGKVVLEIDKDASRLWDLNRRDGVYQLLLWAACTGRIADIVSSPPHRSWPTSQTPRNGPEAYVMRTSDEPYGIKDLAAFQRQRVDEETSYVAKQLMVWMLAQMCGKRHVGFFLGTPASQQRLSERRDEGVSVWSTEMWKNFGSISGIKEFSFYMGAFGHRARCPTTIATTYPSVNQIDYNQGVPDDSVPATLLSDKELRKWPRSFKEFVAEAIKDYHTGSWKDEEEMISAGVKMSKLTKEQREAWHRHLFNDHQPYRADCAVCINAQATGYQHRCPREYMSEKAAAELDKDLYVPDEASEHGDEEFLDGIGGGREAGDVEGLELSEEEGEEVPLGPETMDEAVEGLAQQEEWATIYVTRPLRGRTNHYVVQAAKEILLQLRQSGLHVGMVHTDRAREFKAKAFKDWTVDSQLRHTKTAGADPAGNSSAELGIKWAKARVRTLLTASGAPQRDWPMAIQHAASDTWARTFPDSPWTSPPATAFGNEVWFRSKAYQGKREKKHEAAGSRWKKGWYRGPAVDVKRGHLIVREDGGLTVAKSVKFGVFEPNKDLKGILSPAVAEGLPEEEEIREEPPTRLELKEEIEFRARKLLEEENFNLEEVVNLYKLLELRGDSDTRLGRKTKITSWYTGAFVHGGVAGVRANLKEFPHTTVYLVKVAKHYCGEVNFSALGIAKNAQLGLHRDSHNYSLSKNYVIPLVDVEGGSLWVQDDEVEEDSAVYKALNNGKVVRGKCLEFKKGFPMEFSPQKWHEVQPWVGERLVLLMYTPRATKLSTESVEALQEVGFGIDPLSLVHAEEDLQDEDETREPLQDDHAAMVKMLHVSPDHEEENHVFVEIEEDEVFQQKGISNPARHLQQASHQGCWDTTARKVIKKAEVQYTAGIEDLLNNLKNDGKSLEVTHNVSLQDVRKNIDAWKESALKEFTNLTKVKQAFRVVKRSELPSNCRIVPCKGVYTVKPDKSELGYRRKTRFVACGNHVPEGEGDFDLFATGVDATSLRTMLAVNARKPWRIGTTDVRQAFVLAKWRGDPVAMEPPGIALELGLAAPGDMWYVEQAIYGLRESPALWSQFRDEQMRMARWTMEVEGEKVTMMIQQLVTDNQIWKIVRESQPQGEVYGYIMVYIDDLLIHAQEQAMHGFFQWVSAKWEVDALDVLDYDHPIRFLGMELHRVKNGFELSQEGFIGEILRAHHHKGGRSCSQGPKETLLLSDEEEQALIQAEPAQRDPQDPAVKEAQRRVGELLWLMGRTRPDIQHTVSIMAARLLRCPEMVNKIGERLLDYLNETKHYRLAFTQNEEDIVDGLDIFTDSSLAPSGGRSQGAAAVFYGNNPLVWRSGRQQLTTLSTAESELVESVEGTLLGLSTRDLLTELLGEPRSMSYKQKFHGT